MSKALPDLSFAQQDYAQINTSLETMNQTASKLSKSLSSAFSTAQTSSKSFDQSLQSITTNLGKIVVSNTSTSLASIMQSGLSAIGTSLQSSVSAFADGGIVNQPQFFSSASGGMGLMGERGAEAIIPLARGPDGQLGLKADQQPQGQNISVHLTTPDVSSFQRSHVQIASLLAKAVARGQRSF